MDEYSGGKTVPKRESCINSGDSTKSNGGQNIQFCNCIGCSGRLNPATNLDMTEVWKEWTGRSALASNNTGSRNSSEGVPTGAANSVKPSQPLQNKSPSSEAVSSASSDSKSNNVQNAEVPNSNPLSQGNQRSVKRTDIAETTPTVSSTPETTQRQTAQTNFTDNVSTSGRARWADTSTARRRSQWTTRHELPAGQQRMNRYPNSQSATNYLLQPHISTHPSTTESTRGINEMSLEQDHTEFPEMSYGHLRALENNIVLGGSSSHDQHSESNLMFNPSSFHDPHWESNLVPGGSSSHDQHSESNLGFRPYQHSESYLGFRPYQHSESNLVLGGSSFHDQHSESYLLYRPSSFQDQYRDMRLDIDNMSYEELLALEERIGSVSTALSEDALGKFIKKSVYKPCSSAAGSSDTDGCVDDTKCSICQEEYNIGDETGRLQCKHSYHYECIDQWLRQKNWCPVCKSSAAT